MQTSIRSRLNQSVALGVYVRHRLLFAAVFATNAAVAFPCNADLGCLSGTLTLAPGPCGAALADGTACINRASPLPGVTLEFVAEKPNLPSKRLVTSSTAEFEVCLAPGSYKIIMPLTSLTLLFDPIVVALKPGKTVRLELVAGGLRP